MEDLAGNSESVWISLSLKSGSIMAMSVLAVKFLKTGNVPVPTRVSRSHKLSAW